MIDLKAYDEINDGLVRGSGGSEVWKWQLDRLKDADLRHPVVLANALVFCELSDAPLPRWLFGALASVLSELASSEAQQFAQRFRQQVRAFRSREIMDDRYQIVLLCRRAQGESGYDEHALVNLTAEEARLWLRQRFGEHVTDFGSSWEHAWDRAAQLLTEEGGPSKGKFETIKQAYTDYSALLKNEVHGVEITPTLGARIVLGLPAE